MTTDIRHFSTETYNGWKNYETWNAALWVSNDYEIYKFVLGLVNSNVTRWSDVSSLLEVMFGEKTQDGVFWADADPSEMTRFLSELLD